MEATRPLQDVPETALRDTSDATVANASGAVGNAMEGIIAETGATKIHLSVVRGHP